MLGKSKLHQFAIVLLIFSFLPIPMIGFDPVAVSSEFGLDENTIPAMLVTVGYALQENWPQKPRYTVNEVSQIV